MANTIRIDLSEQLGAGQYIEIRDPKYLSWGTQRKFASIGRQTDDTNAQLDALEEMVIALVKNLNVFDEDNNPITLPLDNDKLAKLPGVAVEAVVNKFVEVRGKGADLPKS